MGWPIPKTRTGWIAAGLLVVVAFLAYYLWMFPILLGFYESALHTTEPTIEAWEPENCCEEELEALGNVTVRVNSPYHIASFGRRWVYVTLWNQGENPLEDTEFWLELSPEGDPEAIESWALPFLFGGSSLVQRSIHFGQIDPHAAVSGRIPVFATRDVEVTMQMRLGDCIAQALVDEDSHLEVFLKHNRKRFLAHSLVETILLPPWSNGFLVVAAFIVSCLAEPDEEEITREQIGLGLPTSVFINSLQSLMIIWMIVLTLVSIPWLLWRWKSILLLLPFLVILLPLIISKLGIRLIKLSKHICEEVQRLFSSRLEKPLSRLDSQRKRKLSKLAGPVFMLLVTLVVVVCVHVFYSFVSRRTGRDVEPILEAVMVLLLLALTLHRVQLALDQTIRK